MINYGKVYSDTRPQEVEITTAMVFVASNIEEYTKEIDEHIVNGYKYDYVGYTKDEYIQNITDSNAQAIAELEEELRVTKILLGVE